MTALDLADVAAYIDAGTGSYLLAAIASGAAGLWMFFRSGLSRLRRKVRGESAESAVESTDESAEDAVSPEGEGGEKLVDEAIVVEEQPARD